MLLYEPNAWASHELAGLALIGLALVVALVAAALAWRSQR